MLKSRKEKWMCMFQLLFILSAVLMPDAEGWVPVERPLVSEEGVERGDPSIWVYFGKEIGGEKMWVQFPDEPQYRYLGEAEMELKALSNGVEHRLQVLSSGSGEEGTTERQDKATGEWLYETVVVTEKHLYWLQTRSIAEVPLSHEKFVKSLDIQNIS